jgi:hypothetical protein
MKYHTFKDSQGIEFKAMVSRESGRGVDTIYFLEDPYYFDKTGEPIGVEVTDDELDIIYNKIGWENDYL